MMIEERIVVTLGHVGTQGKPLLLDLAFVCLLHVWSIYDNFSSLAFLYMAISVSIVFLNKIHMYICYTHIRMYVHTCVCVCVCVEITLHFKMSQWIIIIIRIKYKLLTVGYETYHDKIHPYLSNSIFLTVTLCSSITQFQPRWTSFQSLKMFSSSPLAPFLPLRRIESFE